MRKLLLFAIFLWSSLSIVAQIIPTQNSDDDLIRIKVNSVTSYYSQKGDSKEFIIFQKEFSSPGKLMRKFQLSLWDAVSYSNTTNYSYNALSQLVEETKTQEILNLFDRDNDYINNFGDTPLNEKILYHYNDDGLLSKKSIYTYGNQEPENNDPPDQTINCVYEEGSLSSEESTSLDDKFFNKNYLVKYKYDSLGNLIGKSMAYGKDKELQRSTLFRYDSNGQIVEEQIVDSSIPHNNIHVKYEYNNQNKLSSKYVYDEVEKEFELDTSYQYDEQGNVVSGGVSYEYYENGLIKSESWIDPTTDEVIKFTTTYEYF